MAKFFVGQRVRVVYVTNPLNWYRVGQEDRVRGFWESGEIALQSHPLPGGSNAVSEDQIEPILDQHAPGSWEVIEQLLPNIREGVAA